MPSSPVKLDLYSIEKLDAGAFVDSHNREIPMGLSLYMTEEFDEKALKVLRKTGQKMDDYS
jgi:hypothetical protein